MKNKINGLRLATALILIGTIVPSLTGCDSKRDDRPAAERTSGERIDDRTLTARVKSALSDNSEYKFGEVNVATFRGTVQLSGFVNTADQKSKAGEIAKNVQDVKEVENKITLKP